MRRAQTSGVAAGSRVQVPADSGPSRNAGAWLSVEQFADRLGVSRNLVLKMIERGELQGVERIGRRVLIAWPVWQLRSLGVRDPEQLGQFARGLGIRDVSALCAFLESEQP